MGVQGLNAQATDGNLVGTVIDQTGAAVPNALVEITSTTTGAKQSVETNTSGEYRFNNLLAGNYDLKVTHTGFATQSLRNLAVALNKTATQNVTLAVGNVSTVVEVSATAVMIDTTTAQVGSTFQSREAIDSPASSLVSGVLNLSLLGAGVASSGGIGLGDGPSVGGQRPRNNSFTVEGVDNNRKDVTGHNVDIPNEAVAEFSMLQNQFSAEFGNGTGGQFNTVLRSGGNQIHGVLYEYLQNRILNAVDQSTARQGILSNERYDNNTFGGAIGGPIVKNKLFYYGLYQYNPLGSATPSSTAISAPTAAGYATLGSIPGISQTNLNVLKQYLPAANAASGAPATVSGQTIPLGILAVPKPSFTNTQNYLVSIDYNLSDMDRMRGRWVSEKKSGFSDTTLPALPAFFLGRETTQKLFAFSEFHNFSPTLLNEFRFGYNRYNDVIPTGDFQYPGLDVFPNITIDELQLQLGPYDGAPQSAVINTYQLIDNVTWSKGRHNWKFGWEGRKYIAPQTFIQRVRGDYGYGTLERFLLDKNPDAGSTAAQRNVGGAPYSGNQINHSFFINDEFRFRPNLSINLGVRYEYKGIPRGDKLQELNAIASVPGLLTFRAPEAQMLNFAPRVGIAYSPGSSGRTSIRAGFGLAYDKSFDNLGLLSTPPQISSTVDVPPQPTIDNFLKNGGILPTAHGAAACATAQECRDITSSFIPDQKLPYSIQWNFGVQHVFGNDYTFEARYLGTKGVHLFTQSRINVIPKVDSTHFLPTYLTPPSASTLAGLTTTLDSLNARGDISGIYQPYFAGSNITAFLNRGNSNYHGLATELTRRFSRGLLFKGAYTWSHNIDDSTADLFSTLLSPRRPQDFQNMTDEKSDSFLDRRHRFTFNLVYDTPWFSKSGNMFARHVLGGYTLSGTYTYESPQFATVQSNIDANLNGDPAADRAIINPNGVANTGSDVYAINKSGAVVPSEDPSIVAYVARNPNAHYIVAELGALANGGRQTMATRPINNWDLQVKKQFLFGERYRLQFAGQLYNLFNHPQYIPGYLNDIQFHESRQTRNNLIPGNAIFNMPDQVYDSNSRIIQVTARFEF